MGERSSPRTRRGTSIGIAAGETNVCNPAYGDRSGERRNALRGAPHDLPISELPSHVDCETLLGTKNALDGVQERQGETDQPLWQSEDTLVTLNTNSSSRSARAGRSGIYVRQGAQLRRRQDRDYTYVTNRRIANVAAALTTTDPPLPVGEHAPRSKSGQLAGRSARNSSLRWASACAQRAREQRSRPPAHGRRVAFNVVRGGTSTRRTKSAGP